MDKEIEKFKNKLVVFEGSDGNGKSTLAQALYEKLSSEGLEVVLTKQPGGQWGELADQFSSYCKDKKYNFHSLSNLFLFLADRTESVDKIVTPALKEGKTVICDRWYYSTIAYQFYGKQLLEKFQLNKQFAYWLNRVASLNIEPDVVFFVERNLDDVNRMPDDQWDQFETASYDFKLRVRKAYYDMAKESPLFRRIQVIENDVPSTLNKIVNTSF